MKYKTLCSVLLLKGRGTNSVSQNLHAYYQPLCHQNEYKLDSYVLLICLIMVKWQLVQLDYSALFRSVMKNEKKNNKIKISKK